LAALRAYLVKSEAPKVEKLKPARYLMVTSVPLGRQDKQSISEIFAPYVISPADILGNEDIQDYLRDHPEMARQHYKLWLASADVLTLMFNAPIIGRSAFKTDEVLAFAPKYVRTHCHEAAQLRLDDHGSIIIIGEPGIGKSTLAEQLVLNYAVDGYELCFIQGSMEEAESVWSPDRKQIFYFDDFLGRNYLDAISRSHDSLVLGFMRRVQKDKKKRFILTSRTTIMQQGKSLSELFVAHNIDQEEYEVRITDVSAIEKAHILYNHIWFSDLDPAFVEQLYVDKRYREIVSHRNFNPRLISFITDAHKIAGIQAEGYWQYVKATLDNPRNIWRGVFQNQLDQLGRLMVSLVTFRGGEIAERELRAACERARIEQNPEHSASEWSLAFERSYQMSVGAVLTRELERKGGTVTVGLFNPSVGDFVLHQFAKDVTSLKSFLGLLRDRRSLARFQAIRRTGIIGDEDYGTVLQGLTDRFWPDPLIAPEFAGYLTYYILLEKTLTLTLRDQLIGLAARFFDVVEVSTDVSSLSPFAAFTIERNMLPCDDERWLGFVRQAMDGVGDDETLIELSKVVVLLGDPITETAAAELSEHVVEAWRDRIDEEVSQNAIATDYVDDDDHGEAEQEIRKFVSKALDDYSIGFDDDDIDDIVGSCDVDELISSNRRSRSDDEGSSGSRFSGPNVNALELEQIDDLFDREGGR
jgi:hypothetical protein